MSYPYYAVVTDDDDGEIGFYGEPYYTNDEGRIIGTLPDFDEVNVSFLGWAIDLQDVAVMVLRAKGYSGIDGRVKKTGVMLCSWSKMPVNSDYLRISLNGMVINSDEYPAEADLVEATIKDLAAKYPAVVKTLEMLMKLNHQELDALSVIALRNFPSAVQIDVEVIRAVGGLGYVLASARTHRNGQVTERYLVNPSGKTYMAEFNQDGGVVAGDEVIWL